MKPAWDKLMTQFAGHKSILIADVDCTAAGKPLCDSNGVRGFPTIKHGDPSSLEDYQGGRDHDSLKEFAEGLKPLCSPMNMDLCDDEGRAAIEKIQAMSDADLDQAITDFETKLSDAESTFKSSVEKLQSTYEALMKAKESAEAEVKAAGLGLMKSVKAAKKAAAEKEEL